MSNTIEAVHLLEVKLKSLLSNYDFLLKENLFDWINVWDEHHTSRFKVLYDARKTPGIYVLDENKKITAKKITVEQAKNIVKVQLGL